MTDASVMAMEAMFKGVEFTRVPYQNPAQGAKPVKVYLQPDLGLDNAAASRPESPPSRSKSRSSLWSRTPPRDALELIPFALHLHGYVSDLFVLKWVEQDESAGNRYALTGEVKLAGAKIVVWTPETRGLDCCVGALYAWVPLRWVWRDLGWWGDELWCGAV